VAFTYDLTTDIGKVRSRIGDTEDRTDERESLTDAEIQVVLDEYSDLAKAAVIACTRLMALLRSKIDRSLSNVNSSQHQKYEALKDLLEELKAEAGETSEMEPGDGGTSEDGNDAIHDDSDFIHEQFWLGMDDKTSTY
jgi:hypothetical protein